LSRRHLCSLALTLDPVLDPARSGDRCQASSVMPAISRLGPNRRVFAPVKEPP
jgi:hypothetical protein